MSGRDSIDGSAFDLYSEKARRAIFFARYEAGRFGSAMVESEHLLLGILREDRALMRNVMSPPDLVDSIYMQIEARTPVQHEIAIVTPPEILKDRAAGSPVSFDSVRKLIEANQNTFHEHMAKSAGLRFSDECTRSMRAAEDEANRLNMRVGTEHLVLGILREDNCFAAKLLNERGVTLKVIREDLLKRMKG